MKRQLPLIVVLVTALATMLLKFFNFGQVGNTFASELDQWIVISYAFAFLLGPINLIRLHWGNVARRRTKWAYSAFTLVLLAISTVVMLVNGVNGKVSLFLVDNIGNAIDSAIYAMLGFYVCSAAYRSFKLKNTEASILLVAAVILMLGQAPIGDVLIPNISKFANWILNVPNSAGMRAIGIGASIGGFAASIRVVLGLERSWTGSGS